MEFMESFDGNYFNYANARHEKDEKDEKQLRLDLFMLHTNGKGPCSEHMARMLLKNAKWNLKRGLQNYFIIYEELKQDHIEILQRNVMNVFKVKITPPIATMLLELGYWNTTTAASFYYWYAKKIKKVLKMVEGEIKMDEKTLKELELFIKKDQEEGRKRKKNKKKKNKNKNKRKYNKNKKKRTKIKISQPSKNNNNGNITAVLPAELKTYQIYITQKELTELKFKFRGDVSLKPIPKPTPQEPCNATAPTLCPPSKPTSDHAVASPTCTQPTNTINTSQPPLNKVDPQSIPTPDHDQTSPEHSPPSIPSQPLSNKIDSPSISISTLNNNVSSNAMNPPPNASNLPLNNYLASNVVNPPINNDVTSKESKPPSSKTNPLSRKSAPPSKPSLSDEISLVATGGDIIAANLPVNKIDPSSQPPLNASKLPSNKTNPPSNKSGPPSELKPRVVVVVNTLKPTPDNKQPSNPPSDDEPTSNTSTSSPTPSLDTSAANPTSHTNKLPYMHLKMPMIKYKYLERISWQRELEISNEWEWEWELSNEWEYEWDDTPYPPSVTTNPTSVTSCSPSVTSYLLSKSTSDDAVASIKRTQSSESLSYNITSSIHIQSSKQTLDDDATSTPSPKLTSDNDVASDVSIPPSKSSDNAKTLATLFSPNAQYRTNNIKEKNIIIPQVKQPSQRIKEPPERNKRLGTDDGDPRDRDKNNNGNVVNKSNQPSNSSLKPTSNKDAISNPTSNPTLNPIINHDVTLNILNTPSNPSLKPTLTPTLKPISKYDTTINTLQPPTNTPGPPSNKLKPTSIKDATLNTTFNLTANPTLKTTSYKHAIANLTLNPTLTSSKPILNNERAPSKPISKNGNALAKLISNNNNASDILNLSFKPTANVKTTFETANGPSKPNLNNANVPSNALNAFKPTSEYDETLNILQLPSNTPDPPSSTVKPTSDYAATPNTLQPPSNTPDPPPNTSPHYVKSLQTPLPPSKPPERSKKVVKNDSDPRDRDKYKMDIKGKCGSGGDNMDPRERDKSRIMGYGPGDGDMDPRDRDKYILRDAYGYAYGDAGNDPRDRDKYNDNNNYLLMSMNDMIFRSSLNNWYLSAVGNHSYVTAALTTSTLNMLYQDRDYVVRIIWLCMWNARLYFVIILLLTAVGYYNYYVIAALTTKTLNLLYKMNTDEEFGITYVCSKQRISGRGGKDYWVGSSC